MPGQVPQVRATARRLKAGGERFLGALVPGASARRLQVRAFADEWAAANLDARRAAGPLWVVLGDSTAQGIGATTREAGWVGVLHERLRRRDAWRVVNLSRAGADPLDVLTRQLPELAALSATGTPDLVTWVLGAEPRPDPGLGTVLRQVLASLPPGAVVGLPAGAPEPLDAVVREQAVRHGLRVAVLPARPGPAWRREGALGDVEHAAWALALLRAVDGPVAGAAAPGPSAPFRPPASA